MDRHALVVVGQGALGAAAAWQAVELGVEDVLVLDRGAPCSGTSPRGVGLVNLLLEHPEDIGLVKRSIEAFERLDAAAGPSFTYHDTGGLLIVGADQADEAERRRRLWRAQAVDVRRVDPGDVRGLPGTEGLSLAADEHAYLSEGDGWTVTTDAVAAMLDRVEAAGGQLAPNTPVDRVDDGTVHLASGRRIEADAIVLAAGIWTPELIDHAWPVPVQAYRAQAVCLEHGQEATPGPCVHDAVTHAYWRPEGPGKLIIGDGTDLAPHDPEADPRTDPDLPNRLLERLVERWPAARGALLVRAWAGLEAGTPDARPLVGSVPGMDRVVLCTGGNGFGFMRSPALGEAAARIALGKAPPVPIQGARPERFDDPPERFEMREGFSFGRADVSTPERER